MPEEALLTVAGVLYGLTPGEFTATRDAEAKAARTAGDRALADRVKRLRKPSAAAWVVNLLMRERQDAMVQVLDLGESLRQAQADLDGDALRDLARQRRRLVAAVAEEGRALARQRGTKLSEAVARQVEQTLHAAMVDTDAAAAVRTGLLLDPLAPAGLGPLKVADAMSHTAVAALDVPAPEAPPAPAPARPTVLSVVRDGDRVGSDGGGSDGDGSGEARPGRRKTRAGASDATGPGGAATDEETADRERAEREQQERADAERRAEEHRRAVEAADRALAEAEDAADDAKRRRRKADRRVAKLEARGLQLQAEAEELRRRLVEVEHEVEVLDEETSEAEERRDAAQQRMAEAAERLEQARVDRAGLDGSD